MKQVAVVVTNKFIKKVNNLSKTGYVIEPDYTLSDIWYVTYNQELALEKAQTFRNNNKYCVVLIEYDTDRILPLLEYNNIEVYKGNSETKILEKLFTINEEGIVYEQNISLTALNTKINITEQIEKQNRVYNVDEYEV